jgi:hypothetical protein
MTTDRTAGEQNTADRTTDRTTDTWTPRTVRPAGPRATTGGDLHQEVDVIAPRDRVRWGPIFAGLVTALSLFLLLSLLALGLGLTAADAATSPDQTNAIGTAGAIIAAVIGLLAFVIGGFVAARTSAVVGRGAGAMNGFLVWALGIVLILALGAMGVGTIFGAAGDIFGQVQASGIGPEDVPAVDPQQAQEALRNSALAGFVSLALPALAALLGGVLGARKEEDLTELATGA